MNETKKPPILRLKRDHIGLIVVILLALLVRKSMIAAENPDFRMFLVPWYRFIIEHGGFAALRFSFSNYTPPYLYLLALSARLFGGQGDLHLPIKVIPILFDLINALLVYRLVRVKYSTGPLPLYGVVVFLFAPTVLFNSAYWGQADALYTTGLLACTLFLVKGKELPAFLFYGLALAVKLQAIFFAPFLVVMWLYRKVFWKSFLVIPAVYLIAILPAWLAGRALLDLLLIYFKQTQTNNQLTMNAPTLYAWFPNSLYDVVLPVGLLFAAAAIGGLVYFLSRQRIDIQEEQIIALAFLSLLLTPFLLPKMHERYFYPADVLAIIFAFYYPRFFYVPVIMVLVSFFSYFPFLFRQPVIDMPTLAFVLLALIVHLLFSWKTLFNENRGERLFAPT
jgi:Gpi18-like mannosyltransferase